MVHCLPGADVSRRYAVIHALLRLILKLLFRVEVQGVENLPRRNYVIVSNHNNWVDALLILVALPVWPRIWSLAAEDLVWNTPMKAWFFTFTGGVIPVDRLRSSADRAALAAMRGVLDRGGIIALFPEGHIGFYEGRIQPFMHGAALLARQAGVPVVPIGILGTADLWLRKRLVVRIGAQIPPDAGDAAGRHRARATTIRYERAVRALVASPSKNDRCRATFRPRLLRRYLNPWAALRSPAPLPEPAWVTSADDAHLSPSAAARNKTITRSGNA